MKKLDLDVSEDSLEDLEEGLIHRRRIFMYSPEALSKGLPAERIFVRHPALDSALAAFDRIYQLAQAATMPLGMVLVGETGTGKSSLVRYFRSSLPPSTTCDEQTDALLVRLQERPNLGRMISSLLRQVRYPFANVTKGTVSLKKDTLIDALRQKRTRVIFVDEAQHLMLGALRRNAAESHSELTEFLRELMDESHVAIVLVGTATLDDVRASDKNLGSRVTGRIELSSFEGAHFVAFLRAFAKQCKSFPLTKTDLAASEASLMAASGGNPRALKRLLVEAILVAVDSGKEVLDDEVFALAFQRISGINSLASNPFRRAA